ncbi:DUF1481 domain-containing protein [Vibrio lentus]|nr:DUF1481 domain-containing protein [Vibrio lentus]
MGDALDFFWVCKLTQPRTSADYVTMGDYGWYKTDYAWSGGVLREFIREGELRDDSQACSTLPCSCAL